MYYEENDVRGFKMDDGSCYHTDCIGEHEVTEDNIIGADDLKGGYYFCYECKKQNRVI